MRTIARICFAWMHLTRGSRYVRMRVRQWERDNDPDLDLVPAKWRS